MTDDRQDLFQRYFQRLDLASVPALGGWTRKVAELEQHRAEGGRVNEGGQFFVQAGRKADFTVDIVADFFSCLPEKPEGAALIFARYCSPPMLEEYPVIVHALEQAGVTQRGEGWNWPPSKARAAGSYCRAFWKRVAFKRVLGR